MDAKRLIPMLILLVAAVVGCWLYVNKERSGPADSDPAVADRLDPRASDSPVISADEPDAAAPEAPGADGQGAIAAADSPPREAALAAPADSPAPAAPVQPPSPPSQPVSPADQEPVIAWRGTRVAQEQEVTIGSVAPDSDLKLMCRLTNVGAAVEVVKLTDHFVTVDDKRLYEDTVDDPAVYERARQAEPDKYRGHYPLGEPVTVNDRPVGALAVGEVTVRIIEEDGAPGPLLEDVDLSDKKWQLVEPAEGDDPNSATFSYTIFHGLAATPADAVLRIYKTYTIGPNDYSIEMSIRLENLSAHELKVSVDQIGPTGLPKEDVRGDSRRAAYGWFVAEDQAVEVKLENRKRLNKMFPGQRDVLGRSDNSQPVVWVGTTNKYFATLMYLRPDESAETYDQARLSANNWHGEFYIRATDRPNERAYLTGVKIGAKEPVSLPAGEAKTIGLSVYAGPKDRAIFVDPNNPLFKPLYRRLDYLSTIEFGGCFCTMTWLAMRVIWLLGVIAGVVGNNYGVAIIVLVILVRLCLHPLTKKSQVSMMKMQKLQPQIQKLREKYADDKDTLNKEMMRIYKEQGATPLLGCLPMLLQMPILIALFTGINASVQLRHAAFLPVWITDLAAPDALFSWSKPLPLIGNTFNLLPILLCVVMYLQTKMNPQMAGQQGGTSQQAGQQAKMMKIMMPAMMLVFFYKAASGLTLYFMTSMAAGVADQWAVRRHIRMQEEVQAASETTIEMPGKAARGHRPKKPKDPYKTGF